MVKIVGKLGGRELAALYETERARKQAHDSVRSERLHTLMKNYALSVPDKMEQTLGALKDYLNDHTTDAEFMLAAPVDHAKVYPGTHLHQALYLPFSSEKTDHDDPALKKQKAKTLFNLLVDYIHTAISTNKITKQEYIGLLTSQNGAGFTLLQEAVITRDLELIKKAFDEVNAYAGDKNYFELLAKKNDENYNLLLEAVATGSPEIARYVFGEVRVHVPPETVKELLTTSTKHNWNVFHTITQYRNYSYAGNDMLGFLINQFYEVFNHESWSEKVDRSRYDLDQDEARKALQTLYAQRTDTGDIPAFNDHLPKWITKILELSGRDPVKPTPRYR